MIGIAPIAGGVTLLALGLMAWDHLWGNQRGSRDSFPVDPVTFLVAFALIVVAGLVVLGVTVPRAIGKGGSTSRAAMVHSGIALLLALPASWLGFPAVLAGGGIVLGTRGLAGDQRRLAIVAIGVGLLVMLFAILATAFPSPRVTDPGRVNPHSSRGSGRWRSGVRSVVQDGTVTSPPSPSSNSKPARSAPPTRSSPNGPTGATHKEPRADGPGFLR